ncbi:MAG: uracil-DNA glycosylase family protein [Alphaproteobacteria bacterium]
MTAETVPPFDAPLAELHARITACRVCRDAPDGSALPHEPRPVLRISSKARICLCGQAPGTRVHASGMPFTDPSGDRLREWMGVSDDEFYDTSRVAIVPMGFCFPGLDAKGGDLPPRPECARHWRRELFDALPGFELIVLIGHYAQRWHLGTRAKSTLTATVENWAAYARDTFAAEADAARAAKLGTGAAAGASKTNAPRFLPLPHPSWRNNAWLKRNPWFEAEVIPYLRAEVRRLLTV